MKIKVGITGQEGFVGQHLYNSLGLFPDKFERVGYDITYFSDEQLLNDFVGKCDVIVHLAALNRHNDPQVIYDTNIQLVKKLIDALKNTQSKAHVLFSSSSQEERDNLYGKSKLHGRELLIDWARESGGKFSGLVIPNVFGPFGSPYYNSFIATFSHQLTHNEQPKIDVDGTVKLIYVSDLVKLIIDEISRNEGNHQLQIPHTDEQKVSEILSLLEGFKDLYFKDGIIPELKSKFELNLFNTFRCYMDIENHNPVKLKKNTDARGSFVEIIKLNIGGQVSFSTTVPGITRGNHFHTRKIERFAVIKGKALIQLRRVGTDEVFDFYLDGEEPAYVDMPIWYTHNIKNIGDDVLYTNFWINEFFDPEDADTYMETV
ncbi:UDP-2-acetamido-2,6-beta-L-arabino-hexul-4-ose reductase [Mucilaginibacter yixingensis]|uniref:UDP-2-acetamido-2,6-beta-L-arabino-hexul-4-ose reductase n=1 Tax=Mucilaginibacter yixingensis TaxID=1295612 RepID=A0A2T5JGQ3_9SPHI|nr:NAD-dependent epimerase/dehydratase family protein [Mucilaginibacter yixingensis]PTR01589.1 UDP-2-acetamido-2,6-beta-L-arabino-hexul-4-ose reductase [Mucilaginibacter yixingensis]